MSGFFGVLRDDSSSEDDDNRDVYIPSYEDLSTARADEETVLQVVYAQDFRRYDGVWGCSRLEVDVRPPDVESKRIGSQLW